MVNKVTLIGHLGQDPEVHAKEGGKTIANFTLATNETWSKEGEKQEHTEWHRIVAFDHLAAFCGEHLHQGLLVYLEGRLQTRKWEDKEGATRYTTEIVARELKILTPKNHDHQSAEAGPAA